MLKHLSNMQKVSVYLVLVLAIVFMIVVLPIEQSTSLFMFVPFVAVLITMLLSGEMFTKAGWKQLGFHRFQLKTFLGALVIPMIPILIGYIIVWLAGIGTFELEKEYEGRGVFLFVGFFITLIASSLTVTLGEEIGWRGYLAAKLRSIGLEKALLLNGFIWGLFHLPIILFTDIYHTDVNLLTFIPMFMTTVTLAGAFITYVRYASGSIWPAIIAHSAHNVVWNYGELFTQNPHPVVTYITGDAGAVLIIFYLIIFIWIIKKSKGKKLL
ncbi:CPBP family intramembrane glutamic endopeptidase [Bacillus sp. CGMCC 1.16607]|uniref:CPBP family intramembrane glutamic endopeptidase n=1 Tax=Bacillus sp. CGMCC 1.16607 TaxID=3351842 RepID=UPI00362C76C0